MFEKLRKDINQTFTNKKLDDIFNKCFLNTIDTTLKIDNGDYLIITGDIPAMWLRDSAMQVFHYLHYIEDKDIQQLIKGTIRKQFSLINIDPYANAFMHDESCVSEWDGKVQTDYLPKIVWERKFELDSLCYPFFLCCKYYELTNDLSIFDNLFISTFDKAISTIKTEKNHSKSSSYYFIRGEKENIGRNTNPDEEKGLVWSGFRPSDDACQYHYHIPDNMFLVSVLYKLAKVFKAINDSQREQLCEELVNELKELINKYGVVNVKGFGQLYVSETNCLGDYNLNDDANVPSLLSLPFLEYPFLDEKIYLNTRKYILSNNNKYYYEGKLLKGIGSPHTPANRVWPLSLSMQGITSSDEKEIINCLNQLITSTNNGYLMHESVDCDNPAIYSRPWFAWANSQFALFVLKHKDLINKKWC